MKKLLRQQKRPTSPQARTYMVVFKVNAQELAVIKARARECTERNNVSLWCRNAALKYRT